MNVDKMRHARDRAAVAKGLAFARSQAGTSYVWGGIGPEGYEAGGLSRAVSRWAWVPPIGSTATNPNPGPVEPSQPRIWPDGYAIVPAGWGTVADLLAWMTDQGIPLSAELSTNMIEEVSLEWTP